MFTRIVLKRGKKPEGESPFWISFSDLMSALMMLFLLVMAVTLLAVAKQRPPAEQAKIQREVDIRELMATIKKASREYPDVKVDENTYRIDLGNLVLFDRGRSDIRESGAKLIRSYVPTVLQAQSTQLGKRWIRRVVVEGFTDQDGNYLDNLRLSLDRSRRVVCVLFARPSDDEVPLTLDQKRQIRDLFLVGGYSFNSIQKSKEASRRAELRVDFWSLDEANNTAPEIDSKDFGQC